mgnify:CR=1 FL=1
MGFTASTTQAFQYSLPYQQVFNAATSGACSIVCVSVFCLKGLMHDE